MEAVAHASRRFARNSLPLPRFTSPSSETTLPPIDPYTSSHSPASSHPPPLLFHLPSASTTPPPPVGVSLCYE
ncbi:uncharacterized protein K452DRAFT_24525 [Aplosporella prunicola CBS 121167]|uniref:Uncharacterized protein n=1 Tax=Aplosporella prunicola CBS 121167 TaxID=1176127 RepID=A0A6A6BEN7_9PEZI|nr:uncharacterized protein K452DRAFT_24525 [Aplosporella prunicola CBS 121167]KAF2141998.1 hypothetical protein K452DRAFT_24525 [Aplosporella prunicola CBS 121167]